MRLSQQRAYDAQRRQIEHIEEFIGRFDMQLPKEERAKKHPAIVAQIESRKRQLEKMEKIEDGRDMSTSPQFDCQTGEDLSRWGRL